MPRGFTNREKEPKRNISRVSKSNGLIRKTVWREKCMVEVPVQGKKEKGEELNIEKKKERAAH